MKKITAIFLALAVLVLFASCDNNDNPTTTQGPIATGYVPSQSSTVPSTSTSDVTTVSTAPSTSASGVGLTYVLTTSPDKTVPWSETTRFDANSVVVPSTTGSSLSDIPTPTGGTIDKPSVNTSQLPTQQSTTAPSAEYPTGATSTTKPIVTTKEKTTKATTAANKTPTQLVINDTSYNSSTSIVTLAVSNDGWMSTFVAKSQNISIIVDGEEIETTVPCNVTSKTNADGCQLITIDLSSQSLNSGSNVTFTIPAGLVQTKAGTQYNTSYTGYVVL